MSAREREGHLMKSNQRQDNPIGAMFEFWRDGRNIRLRNVYLVADNNEDEGLLKGALSKLINPVHLERLKRMIRRPKWD